MIARTIFTISLFVKETRIHQIPVDQTCRQTNCENNHDDDLVTGCLRLAGFRWESQEEESANNADRRERRQLQRVATGSQQFMPGKVGQSGKDDNQDYCEQS